MDSLKLGSRYQELRELVKDNKGKELSQRRLAKETGIATPRISDIEAGNRKPTISEVQAYHKFFNKYFKVSYDYLLGESKNLNPWNIETGRRLGLKDKSIEILEIYSHDADSYFIKTINELICDRQIIRSISKYLYGELIPSNPPDLGEGYPPLDFVSFFMKYRDQNIDKKLDVSSLEYLHDEDLRRIHLLAIHSRLEKLLMQILSKEEKAYKRKARRKENTLSAANEVDS